jgi:hypothetical protein
MTENSDQYEVNFVLPQQIKHCLSFSRTQQKLHVLPEALFSFAPHHLCTEQNGK